MVKNLTNQERIIAIIPLRAGSKGIIHKNRIKILGRPLFTWVLSEAIESDFDHIYVFTDDSEIKNYIEKDYSWTSKISVVERSEESASDTASTEFAMMELAEKVGFNFSHYFLLQATSPLTTKVDINAAIEQLKTPGVDSVLSVVKTHRFIWDTKGKSLNYDYMKRPRRQDFGGLLIENGAIYGCTKRVFLEYNNRLGGNIKIVEMPEDTLTEIDEPSDLLVIEQLLKNRLQRQKSPSVSVKYLVLDVDGVFTSATVAYSADGEFSKTFSFVDGMGLEILREAGIQPIIITSEKSQIVKKRMEKLEIQHCYMGVKDKYAFLNNLVRELKASRNAVAYLGDDINDLANILSSGWGICPANAVHIVKNNADLSLQSNGGEGAIRECVEFLINYNKRFSRG